MCCTKQYYVCAVERPRLSALHADGSHVLSWDTDSSAEETCRPGRAVLSCAIVSVVAHFLGCTITSCAAAPGAWPGIHDSTAPPPLPAASAPPPAAACAACHSMHGCLRDIDSALGCGQPPHQCCTLVLPHVLRQVRFSRIQLPICLPSACPLIAACPQARCLRCDPAATRICRQQQGACRYRDLRTHPMSSSRALRLPPSSSGASSATLPPHAACTNR